MYKGSFLWPLKFLIYVKGISEIIFSLIRRCTYYLIYLSSSTETKRWLTKFESFEKWNVFAHGLSRFVLENKTDMWISVLHVHERELQWMICILLLYIIIPYINVVLQMKMPSTSILIVLGIFMNFFHLQVHTIFFVWTSFTVRRWQSSMLKKICIYGAAGKENADQH